MRWSNTPTAAERHCEHANVSLTERLRRDFGIDASESEDDENRGTKIKITASDVLFYMKHQKVFYT